MSWLAETMSALGRLTADGETVLLAIGGDAIATTQLATHTAALSLCSQTFAEEVGTPPTRRLREVADQIRTGCRSLESAVEDLVRGVDRIDPDLLDAATAEIGDANRHLNQARQMLETIVTKE